MKDVWEAKSQTLYAWMIMSGEDWEIKDVSQFSDFGNWMDIICDPGQGAAWMWIRKREEEIVNLADVNLSLKIVLICSSSPIGNWLYGSWS